MAKSKAQTHGFEMGVKIDGTDMICHSFGLTKKPEFQLFGDDEGMTGTPHPKKCARTNVKNDVSGPLMFRPTYSELDKLISLFWTNTPGAGSGDWADYTSYDMVDEVNVDMTGASPANTYPVLLDTSVEGYTYATTITNTFTLRFSENNVIEVELETLSYNEATGAVIVGTAACESPVTTSDLTLSLGATLAEYFAIDGELVITRNYNPRFHNNTNLSAVSNGKTEVTLTTTLDYNSDTQDDLFALVGTNTAVKARLIFTDGTDKVGFDIPEGVISSPTPERPGEGEFTPTLEIKGSYDGTNKIITAYTDLA
jgi:hypothetical protein